VRVIRDGQQIYEGQIATLRRFKDDARDGRRRIRVRIAVANFQDIKVGDLIEAHQMIETKRTLA